MQTFCHLKKQKHNKINNIFSLAIHTILITIFLIPNVSSADDVSADNVTVITPTVSTTDETEQQATSKNNQPLEIKENSLASEQMPTENQLSRANQELLTNNAYLQRQINDLETQVNVLINERSGQLFLYGVLTVIFSFIAGVIATLILKKKRDNHW